LRDEKTSLSEVTYRIDGRNTGVPLHPAKDSSLRLVAAPAG
jgi:hypothetical protein